MEDLFTTETRLANLKSLGRKSQKKKAPKNARNNRLLLDLGAGFHEMRSFYDIDSASASRRTEDLIDSAFESSESYSGMDLD